MSKLSSAERDALPDRAFAFPKERKEPIPDKGHVISAIRLFMKVEDVTDEERDQAWKRIKAAAKKFGVHVEHEDWREMKQIRGSGRSAEGDRSSLDPAGHGACQRRRPRSPHADLSRIGMYRRHGPATAFP